MGLTAPSGKNADWMLNPGGWPSIDENVTALNGEHLPLILLQLSRALEKRLGVTAR